MPGLTTSLGRSPEEERRRKQAEQRAQLAQLLGKAAPIAGGAAGTVGGALVGSFAGPGLGTAAGAGIGGGLGAAAGGLTGIALDEYANRQTRPFDERDAADIEKLRIVEERLRPFLRF